MIRIIDNREHVKPTPCPYCGELLDDAAGVSKDAVNPTAGDLSLCIGCGGVLVFDENCKPTVLTESVKATIEPSQFLEMQRLGRAIRVAHTTSISTLKRRLERP